MKPLFALSPRRLPVAAKTVIAMIFAATIGATPGFAAQDRINPPPSAQLDYTIRASVQGLSLEGSGTILWRQEAAKYQLQFDTKTALTGTLLSEKSEGTVEKRGLQPASFRTKRLRKEAVMVTFDRQAGSIQFPGNTPAVKIEGGEQDRISVLWQLLSMARAMPARFTVGSPWKFIVIGHRGAEDWTFSVLEKEKLRTALGDVDSLHLVHQPADDANAPKVDIWLAPSLDWFPVRLRFSEPNGDSIEQTISSLRKG